MPPAPPIGAEYTYSPPHGNAYGHHHKGSDLSAEMQELDLQPGTQVFVLDIDEESGGRVHVEWIDSKELPRITSVDPQEFNTDFKKV
jgi:hypothetical protein